jgi:hypothetical protein
MTNTNYPSDVKISTLKDKKQKIKTEKICFVNYYAFRIVCSIFKMLQNWLIHKKTRKLTAVVSQPQRYTSVLY